MNCNINNDNNGNNNKNEMSKINKRANNKKTTNNL